MPEAVRNIGASVRARLLRISKEKGLNFDLVLAHYAIERLLYRLAQSRHADRFVLKGAMLLMTWFDEPFRGTRDLDLLGYGDPAPEAVPDGLSPTFAKDAVKRQQWEGFKRDLSVDPGPLDSVVSAIEAFLMPAAAAARGKRFRS